MGGWLAANSAADHPGARHALVLAAFGMKVEDIRRRTSTASRATSWPPT
jgi:hypothetical protein